MSIGTKVLLVAASAVAGLLGLMIRAGNTEEERLYRHGYYAKGG